MIGWNILLGVDHTTSLRASMVNVLVKDHHIGRVDSPSPTPWKIAPSHGESGCSVRGASETQPGGAKKVLGRYLSTTLVMVDHRRLPLGRLAPSLVRPRRIGNVQVQELRTHCCRHRKTTTSVRTPKRIFTNQGRTVQRKWIGSHKDCSATFLAPLFEAGTQ